MLKYLGLILFSFSVFAQDQVVIQMRTVLIGDHIAGAADDGRFFAIVCSRGLVFSSSADLVFQNSAGDLTVKDYSRGTRVAASVEPLSPYVSMTDESAALICNNPNGVYTLAVDKVNGVRKASVIAEHNTNANSGRRNRGF